MKSLEHKSTAAPRMPALDGIRGLAIALVLCHNLQLLKARA
jgi:peptidoglycan/LPS O-acetylase OafA/YrhL